MNKEELMQEIENLDFITNTFREAEELKEKVIDLIRVNVGGKENGLV